MTPDPHVIEELGGYVLEALELEERDAVRAHLLRCPACAAEHDRLAGLPALLALAGTPEEAPAPPARLEDSVLHRYAETPSPRAPTPTPPPPRSWRRSWRRRLTTGGWRPALAGAAAGALATAALALLLGGDGAPRPPAPPGATAAGQPFEVVLRPVPGVGGCRARARVQLAPNGTRVRLRVEGLPVARAGESYHLWLMRRGERVDAGAFQVDERGEASVSLGTDAAPDRFSLLGVTRAPDRMDLLVGRLPS